MRLKPGEQGAGDKGESAPLVHSGGDVAAPHSVPFAVRAVGFFSDAYDLFVMNIVNVVLAREFTEYDKPTKSRVTTAVIAGVIVGQVGCGLLADRVGRHTIFVVSCLLLIVGGLLCVSAYAEDPNDLFWVLSAARGVLGVGIGGEYPLSATVTSESSLPHDRGLRIGLVFAMQGVGSVCAALCGYVLVLALCNDEPPNAEGLDATWRLLFAIGVIPPLWILYGRLKMEETVYFDAAQGKQVSRLQMLKEVFWPFVGVALTWMILDIIFYAQRMWIATLLNDAEGGAGRALSVITLENLVITTAQLPGYYFAAYLVDSWGRKRIQIQGYLAMAVLMLLGSFLYSEMEQEPFLLVTFFCVTFFFTNFGPNTTTFIIAAEAFPTPIRATCHGLAAAMGKVGALIGVSTMIALKDSHGMSLVMGMWCALSCVGAAITYLLVEETKGVDLAERDHLFEARVGSKAL